PVGDTSDWVGWTFEPQSQATMDTKLINVNILDEFGYTGSSQCSVVVDSIRTAQFQVACMSAVDSVVVDTVIGEYVNGIFTVSFVVSNTGTDYADSVVASLSIQSPDMILSESDTSSKPLWLEAGHTLATG